MSLPDFLATIVRVLDRAQVPYMLTGSLAAAYYATPRATQDVDIVISTPDEQRIHALVDGLQGAGCYVDRDAALEAWRARGQFNAIDPDRGWKVDLIVRKDRPFSVHEFERRSLATLFGVDTSLARVEDIILAKVEWSQLGDSELQRRDVVQLLERRWSELDHPYLEFRGVAVMACDDEVVPLQNRIDEVADPADLEEVYDTERHLLYVACTRARDRLYVSGVQPASEFLDDLEASSESSSSP